MAAVDAWIEEPVRDTENLSMPQLRIHFTITGWNCCYRSKCMVLLIQEIQLIIGWELKN
jgi:hypothetical protein